MPGQDRQVLDQHIEPELEVHGATICPSIYLMALRARSNICLATPANIRAAARARASSPLVGWRQDSAQERLSRKINVFLQEDTWKAGAGGGRERQGRTDGRRGGKEWARACREGGGS